MSPPREPTVIKVPINEFKVSSLPASVKSKWEPFGREPGQTDKRAHALKGATYRIYRAIEVGCGLSDRSLQASYWGAAVVQDSPSCVHLGHACRPGYSHSIDLGSLIASQRHPTSDCAYRGSRVAGSRPRLV
jgi:hypothetical protein